MTRPFSSANALSKEEKNILFYIYDHADADHSFTVDRMKKRIKNYQLMRKWEGRGWVVKRGTVNNTWIWKLTEKAVDHIKAYRNGTDLPLKNTMGCY